MSQTAAELITVSLPVPVLPPLPEWGPVSHAGGGEGMLTIVYPDGTQQKTGNPQEIVNALTVGADILDVDGSPMAVMLQGGRYALDSVYLDGMNLAQALSPSRLAPVAPLAIVPALPPVLPPPSLLPPPPPPVVTAAPSAPAMPAGEVIIDLEGNLSTPDGTPLTRDQADAILRGEGSTDNISTMDVASGQAETLAMLALGVGVLWLLFRK